MRTAFAALTALALSSCVSVSATEHVAQSCVGGTEARTTAQVFFGRNIGDRMGVSDADWARFLDQEVSARFPEGLTVFDAQGQWRDTETGRIVREPSKVLLLVIDGSGAARARVAELAAAYRTRFQQQAVGVVYAPGCAAF